MPYQSGLVDHRLYRRRRRHRHQQSVMYLSSKAHLQRVPHRRTLLLKASMMFTTITQRSVDLKATALMHLDLCARCKDKDQALSPCRSKQIPQLLLQQKTSPMLPLHSHPHLPQHRSPPEAPNPVLVLDYSSFFSSSSHHDLNVASTKKVRLCYSTNYYDIYYCLYHPV